MTINNRADLKLAILQLEEKKIIQKEGLVAGIEGDKRKFKACKSYKEIRLMKLLREAVLAKNF